MGYESDRFRFRPTHPTFLNEVPFTVSTGGHQPLLNDPFSGPESINFSTISRDCPYDLGARIH